MYASNSSPSALLHVNTAFGMPGRGLTASSVTARPGRNTASVARGPLPPTTYSWGISSLSRARLATCVNTGTHTWHVLVHHTGFGAIMTYSRPKTHDHMTAGQCTKRYNKSARIRYGSTWLGACSHEHPTGNPRVTEACVATCQPACQAVRTFMSVMGMSDGISSSSMRFLSGLHSVVPMKSNTHADSLPALMAGIHARQREHMVGAEGCPGVRDAYLGSKNTGAYPSSVCSSVALLLSTSSSSSPVP